MKLSKSSRRGLALGAVFIALGVIFKVNNSSESSIGIVFIALGVIFFLLGAKKQL